jgi:hypothetical protein
MLIDLADGSSDSDRSEQDIVRAPSRLIIPETIRKELSDLGASPVTNGRGRICSMNEVATPCDLF